MIVFTLAAIRRLTGMAPDILRKRTLAVFVFFALFAYAAQAQTLYWVGGGGDTEWGNPLNWSGSSGGVGGAGPPAATNDVVFDGSSFSGPGGFVTVTGTVYCRAMTWLNQGGDNPTLQFSASSTLNIHGTMTLHASMSVALANSGERIVFAGTGGPYNVTSAGKVLPQVRFDGVGGTWNLADNLTLSPTRSLRVANGTLNTQNLTVDCGYFIAEASAACAINIGNSRINIRGNTDNGTPVLDLRNPNLVWSMPGASAIMQFTNPTSYLALYTGSTAKTLPDLRFESIPADPADGPADVDINTGDSGNRITFREIRLTRNTGSQLAVTGTTPKTYSENIVLPDNFNTGGADQRRFDGTAAAPPNNNIFQGQVLIGDNAVVVFNGNNTFQQRVFIAGTDDIEDAVRFTADCVFEDVVDITGSYFVFPYRQANVRFNNATFNDDVFLRGKDAVFRFCGFVEQAAGQDFNITDDTKAIFTGTEDNTFSDGIRTGPEPCVFNGNFRLGKRSVATFTNSLSNTFTNLYADNFSVMEFTPMPGTDNIVTGIVSLAGGCHVWVYMSSGVSGRQADVRFNNVQNWTGTVVQDLNATSSPGSVTVNNGVNNGNNTGVNFPTSGNNAVLYWVGGHPSNTSGNNNWSDPRNWAFDPNVPAQQANGTISAGNPTGCIPDGRTNVVFNALSFSAGAAKYNRVLVDVPIAFCRDMTWTDDVNANTGGVLPRLITTSDLHTAMVNGNLRFAPSDRMENYFSGAFEFTANGPAVIDANGTANGPADAAFVTRFNGHVIFSGRGGQWQLNSDVRVNGGTLGNMIFEYGSVSVIDSLGTSRDITLDGNWFVRRPQDGGAQATVNLGEGTVTFNGVNNNANPADNPNNPNPQYIIAGPPVAPNLNDFHNLVVNRQGNDNPDKTWANNANDVVVWNRYDVSATPGTTALPNPNPNQPFNTGITVRNDLSVSRGNLWDSGFQIVGNATGRLTVATDAKLHIGSRDHSETGNNSPMTSRFPTDFVRASIDLQPGSTVVYRAHGHQDVSNVPVYANLYNFNPNKDESSLATLTGPATRKRLALGELQINGRLTIERGILFADNGFQITGTVGTSGLTMQDGGILMLGSSAMDVATSYGTGSNPATNTTGFLSIIAQNTQFPLGFDDNLLNLNARSIVVYNGGAAAGIQQVRGLGSPTPSQQYGHLLFTNTNPAPTAQLEKRFIGPATVRGAFRVYPNVTVTDVGFQITGNDDEDLSMYSNNNTHIPDLRVQPVTTTVPLAGPSQLVVGSPGSSTEFPTFYLNNDINLQTNTTVIYNGGQPDQPVRRLASNTALNNYARLIIRNPHGVAPVVRKTIDATWPVSNGTGNLVVQENLTVESFADFQDAGFQIRRFAAGGVLTMQEDAFLTLGTGSTVAGPAVPNTQFPPNFDVNAVDFHLNSTVRYNAGGGFAQTVTSLPGGYGNLHFTNADTTLGASPSLSTRRFNAATSIRRDFRILQSIEAFDQGFQVTGNATGQMAMDPNTFFYIGDNNAGNGATRFPTNYRTPAISLSDASTVHYWDHASPQEVSVEPTQYGRLLLGRVSGSLAPDNSPFQTKRLTVTHTPNTSVGVRTLLQIYPDCELQDAGLQLVGFAGTTQFVMSRNTRLQVGSAAVATQFPLAVDQSRVDLHPNSTVEYNAGNGAAGMPQLIRGLFDGGSLTSNQNYANVVLTNPTGSAFAEKQLAGNVRIRGNLTTNAESELNVSSNDYNINLQGNWSCFGGRFVSGNAGSTVTFEGGNNQTVITCSTEPYLTENQQDFRNVTFEKAAVSNTVTLASRFAVKGTATFTTGIVLGGGMTAPYTTSPTNVMIFRDNATAAGASDNSLVIGAVRKVGRVSGTFYFPIGAFISGSVPFYRPSGISSAANADASFISQYYLQNPSGPGFDNTALQASQVCSAMPLINVSNREFWIVNRENQADHVFVSLTWRNPQSGGVSNHTGLRVARWNGSLWQNVGGGSFDNYLGAAPGPASGAVMSAFNTSGCAGAVDNFSPFTLSSETEFNPLPATILDFVGRLENGGVRLTWQVNNEINVAHYVVERSPDGVNFTPIDTVAARGNGQLLTYQSLDGQPLDDANYYRLRIEDRDGSHEYSRVVTVRLGANGPLAVTAYPNPSDGTHVYLRASGNFQVTDIFDLTGRRLAYRIVQDNADLRVEFAQALQPGMYVAVLRTTGGVERVKFVVKY